MSSDTAIAQSSQRPAARPVSDLPPRDRIAAHYLADETPLMRALIEQARATPEEKAQTAKLARQLVLAARAGRRDFGGLDAFMHEYGLTNEEGVILMCLAESLLRIPDKSTADRLIAEKIGTGNWERHLGRSDSLLVNASTWGLMLSGKLIDFSTEENRDVTSRLKRLVARSGEPIIREALRQAVSILGRQFVLGRDVEEALKNAKPYQERGYNFSFDMLGEEARTAKDAERYLERYWDAVQMVSALVGPAAQRSEEVLRTRPGISVKLSALHPRYEPSQEARLRRGLGPRLIGLARLASENWLNLTIDAEEANRLELSLQLFGDALADPALSEWNGFGLAVQAYSKRALPVLEWLAEIATSSGRRIPVRLVKGAYWDTEIKFAQEQGLAGYPVFTRKAGTDASYLACARYLLARPDSFFPEFATHNAHTIASVIGMAGGKRAYEFQRLHGMGEALYEEVVGRDKLALPVRIYAPVGGHEELLAYLVRRLLENGANTSFVHRLADDQAPVDDIIADPVERMEKSGQMTHPLIPLPRDLYAPSRRNSQGLPLWERAFRYPLLNEIEGHLAGTYTVGPVIDGRPRLKGERSEIRSPHDNRVLVGSCVAADSAAVEEALTGAAKAAQEWDRRGASERAAILESASDLFEAHRAELMAVMVREAGKTLPNALGDVREAVDFLRYYASEARRIMARPMHLPGPTGERNELSLRGRGVFACIAPWNFPLAIYTGQIAAALAAGNAVAAKPAEQTPITGYLASRLLHKAGVPGDVLQFLPGAGDKVGAALVKDPRVQGVAFTGSNETAAAISNALAARGGAIVPLIAETGGINAMIVDSTALAEQVVRDAVRSAFDSAGQRCSALRVLFLQEEVADRMIAMLIGASRELAIGDPLDYATDMGPVIDRDATNALNAHKVRMQREAKTLIDLSPPEGYQHGTFVTPAIFEIPSISMLQKEVFGPILHVVRFAGERLDQVCEAINGTGYGLTLSLHSRIEATADFVAARCKVGNFYVNRNQIGAVVGSQPFGGEGLSGTGPKAGGPHYLPRFATERVRSTDITASGGNAALLSLSADT